MRADSLSSITCYLYLFSYFFIRVEIGLVPHVVTGHACSGPTLGMFSPHSDIISIYPCRILRANHYVLFGSISGFVSRSRYLNHRGCHVSV